MAYSLALPEVHDTYCFENERISMIKVILIARGKRKEKKRNRNSSLRK